MHGFPIVPSFKMTILSYRRANLPSRANSLSSLCLLFRSFSLPVQPFPRPCPVSLLSEDLQPVCQDTDTPLLTVEGKELVLTVTVCLTKDVYFSFWRLPNPSQCTPSRYPSLFSLFTEQKHWDSERASLLQVVKQDTHTWPDYRTCAFNHDLTIIFSVTPKYPRVEGKVTPMGWLHIHRRGESNLLWKWACLWL